MRTPVSRVAISAALCLAVAAAVAEDLPGADLQPVAPRLSGGGDGIGVVEHDTDAAGIASHTLSAARALYRNLLLARRAAGSRNTLDVRLAVHSAERELDALYGPTRMDTLMRESAVIREDLRDTGHAPDPHLWLPLEAELTDIRVRIPATQLHRASAAIRIGTRAASRGDRANASAALDDLETALGYRFALLPLRQVRGDLQSAQEALMTDPPRWRGVSEAIDSALGSVRWATDVHAQGWISAYQHAADALAELGHAPAQAKQSLQQVRRDLYAWPQGTAVSRYAAHLAAQPTVNEAQIYHLLDRIRELIPSATPA